MTEDLEVLTSCNLKRCSKPWSINLKEPKREKKCKKPPRREKFQLLDRINKKGSSGGTDIKQSKFDFNSGVPLPIFRSDPKKTQEMFLLSRRMQRSYRTHGCLQGSQCRLVCIINLFCVRRSHRSLKHADHETFWWPARICIVQEPELPWWPANLP